MRLTSRRFTGFAIAIICLAGFSPVGRADVRLPAIFGEHMVFQAGIKIPVWGWADPGEQVTITAGESRASTTTAANGKWSAVLDPLKLSDQPIEVLIAGKNKIEFHDVLVGDVWICSGQSNMEFPLRNASNAKEATAKAYQPTIRLFLVKQKIAFEPQDDCGGQWVVCTPQTVDNFSAVGYFFAREIQDDRHVPIGLIGSYWGGTPAQAWTSLEALQADPGLKRDFADGFEKLRSNLANLTQDYELANAEWQKSHDQWEKEVKPAYDEAMRKWTDDTNAAKTAGLEAPPRPRLGQPEPQRTPSPLENAGTPTVLFNGMIAPIIPYAIKGVIWYQGESNEKNALQYRTLFPAMIADWRARWGEAEFPFLWVQLANYRARSTDPTQTADGWPGVREAQSMALKLPNTGQAVIIDVGDADNIHPTNKLAVGQRLALAARHVAYGEDLVCSGPTLDTFKIDGGAVRLSFKNVGGGLVALPPGAATAPADQQPLKGFSIAGPDHHFVWATATIDGDDVIVSSPEVRDPQAVRYAWANNPLCNLYNREGLPASPFRTDAWTDEGAAKKPVPAPKHREPEHAPPADSHRH